VRERLPRATKNGLPFVTRIPLEAEAEPPAAATAASSPAPTHVLYEGVAHPVDPAPFLIGVAIPEGCRGLNLNGAPSGISRHHVTLHRAHGKLVVEDHSRYGSFLNGCRIEREAPLRTGDRLRLGTPGVEVVFIAVKS
jgi:hypothetical protein